MFAATTRPSSRSPRPMRSSTSRASCATTTCTAPDVALTRGGAPARAQRLGAKRTGRVRPRWSARAEYLELGAAANRCPPELDTHDRFGHRVDLVQLPPRLPRADDARAIEHGLHASPWIAPGPGAPRRAGRAVLPAHAGRGRPRLPDHDDLRRGAGAARDARRSPRSGSRRSPRATTTRATCPTPQKRGASRSAWR
ncbi:MAG: hypothetical protein MZV49_22840 [Rhodopseudomonas palustris]|nr:hypothetical protein [Rhodopseudomonas palustris]